jgi:uroporphyrinogen-III decarboxylase
MALQWSLACLEPLLEIGVDVVLYSGVYETTDYWSPNIISELFIPRLQRVVRLVHEAGAKFHYYTVTGTSRLYERYPELGIDIWSAVNPPPRGDVSLAEAKRQVGDRLCLWGGINPEHTLEEGTPEQVRQDVREAISAGAAGGGFVLSTAGSLINSNERIYRNLQAFLEPWREMADY